MVLVHSAQQSHQHHEHHPAATIKLNRHVQIFCNILKDTDAREKLCKMIQYAGQIVSFDIVQHMKGHRNFIASVVFFITRTKTIDDVKSALEKIINVTVNISACREVMRLFKWMYTVPEWRCAQQKWWAQLNSLVKAASMQKIHDTSEETHMIMKSNLVDEKTIATNASLTPLSPPLPILLVNHPTSPFVLLRLPWLSTLELTTHTASIINDMCDDIKWYSKMGLLPIGLIARTERLAPSLWFTTIVIDLTLSFRKLRRLARNLEVIRHALKQNEFNDIEQRTALLDASRKIYHGIFCEALEMIKLLADFSCCIADSLKLSVSQQFINIGSLVSAFTSTYRAWITQPFYLQS